MQQQQANHTVLVVPISLWRAFLAGCNHACDDLQRLSSPESQQGGCDSACQAIYGSSLGPHPHFDVQGGEACEVVQGHVEVVMLAVAGWIQALNLQRLKTAKVPQAPQG